MNTKLSILSDTGLYGGDYGNMALHQLEAILHIAKQSYTDDIGAVWSNVVCIEDKPVKLSHFRNQDGFNVEDIVPWVDISPDYMAEWKRFMSHYYKLKLQAEVDKFKLATCHTITQTIDEYILKIDLLVMSNVLICVELLDSVEDMADQIFDTVSNLLGMNGLKVNHYNYTRQELVDDLSLYINSLEDDITYSNIVEYVKYITFNGYEPVEHVNSTLFD